MTITSTISPTLILGLRFFGFWPGVSYSTIYWLSFMLSMLMSQYFQYLYIFDHLKISELSNLVDGLITTLYNSLTVLKFVHLWIRRRIFHKILMDMDNDWHECINVDQHLHMITIKANISHAFSNFLMGFNTTVAILILLGDYVIRFVFLTEHYNNTARQFPIKMQLPFEIPHTQLPLFEIIAVIIFLYGMLHAWSATILNILIFTLVLHVSGQIDIICHEFRNISRNSLSHLHKSSVSSLGMLVERHNRIITFSENIEQLFSFMALMQVTWNTLVICCLGFIFIISIHNESGFFVLVKVVRLMFGYLAITIEAFVICFVGEYLSFKGESIAQAVYEMPWYDMPIKQRKVIIFILIRSQKQLAITAGKLMPMSFETFTSIIKASASYVSVLYAMC